MSKMAVLDTGFLISLVDKKRPCHKAAKAYYKYFLEH
jgi:predicted nucleic acid-binding protein